MRFIVLSWLLLLAWLAEGAENSVKYCSSVNTGSSNKPDDNTYQSIGACTKQCTSNYAFGIVQGKKCWCSNVAPNSDTNVDASKCNDGCPGYPKDKCGSESDGLFGYIMMMEHTPSSTASGSGTSTGTSTSSSSETTEAPTTTTTGEKVVQTVAGQIHTVTVGDSGATAAADHSKATTTSSDSGLSKGAVAGVAVGSVAGFGAILALLLVWICGRKRQRPNSDPSFNGALLDGRHSKGSQMSFMKGMFSDGHSHTLSAGSSNTFANTPTRRPTFTDNRMKPDTAIYPNGHRDSSVSLQDNEDYSRPVLRLTNPD